MEDAGAQGRTGEPGEGRPREVPSKFAFTQLFHSEDMSQRTDPQHKKIKGKLALPLASSSPK